MTAITAILVTVLILAFGILCIRKPESAIELQRRFYEKINWKIEPIIIKKELKNTKMMGLFMTVVGSVTLILTIVKILVHLK